MQGISANVSRLKPVATCGLLLSPTLQILSGLQMFHFARSSASGGLVLGAVMARSSIKIFSFQGLVDYQRNPK